MTPPFLAFEVVHAAARGKGKGTAHRRDADVIVDISDENAVNGVGVAEDEEAPPEEAAFDKQFLEQFLVAGGDRVVRKGAKELPCRERARRARRQGKRGLRFSGRRYGRGILLKQHEGCPRAARRSYGCRPSGEDWSRRSAQSAGPAPDGSGSAAPIPQQR